MSGPPIEHDSDTVPGNDVAEDRIAPETTSPLQEPSGTAQQSNSLLGRDLASGTPDARVDTRSETSTGSQDLQQAGAIQTAHPIPSPTAVPERQDPAILYSNPAILHLQACASPQASQAAQAPQAIGPPRARLSEPVPLIDRDLAGLTIDDTAYLTMIAQNLPGLYTIMQESFPTGYICPLSHKLFRDPVTVAQTCQTFEKSYLRQRLAQGFLTCPVTGVELRVPVRIAPNNTLREAVEEWVLTYTLWQMRDDGTVELPAEGSRPAALFARRAARQLALEDAQYEEHLHPLLGLQASDSRHEQAATTSTPSGRFSGIKRFGPFVFQIVLGGTIIWQRLKNQ